MSASNTHYVALAHDANELQRHETATVLRDVFVQEVPRILTRRRGAGHTAIADSMRVVELPVTADTGNDVSVTPASATAEAAGYEAGWQAGQRDGVAIGREEGSRAGFETGREEGYQQGLKEGRADGLDEAHAIARRATEERLLQLDQLLSALPAEMLARLHQAENEMAALCFEVICRMAGEAATNPQAVRGAIRQAIQQLGAQLVSIHVHPADLERLKGDSDLNAWLSRQSFQEGAPVQWVADERVVLGGCMLRSPQGSLDARLETQLQAVREIISRGAPHLPEEAR